MYNIVLYGACYCPELDAMCVTTHYELYQGQFPQTGLCVHICMYYSCVDNEMSGRKLPLII